MSNYILLSSTAPRITKRIKIVLFVIAFIAVFWFYFAFRKPDDSSNNKLSEFDETKRENIFQLEALIKNIPTTESTSTNFEEAPKVSDVINFQTTIININSQNANQSDKKPKNILFWTRFFNNTKWYTGDTEEAGEEILKSVQCPVTNCFFTHDHDLLQDETKFDAIVFHIPEYLNPSQVPKSRSEHQLYIMASLESPRATARTELKLFQDFFNLTMTYRMDSDVRWDYGKVIDRKTNEIVAPSPSPKWKQVEEDFYDEEIMSIIKNKTSPIAWFVSNCYTSSYRKQLVKEINHSMPVDIYGKCGKLECPVNAEECDDLLETKYRFYLSFENALCKDYVTEKLYRALTKFIIPIVYNGGDSSLFAPPKSYINANDFENVKELTKYLQFLTENPREYLKYFWWKKHYVIKMHPTYPYLLCDLCKKLNDENFMTKSHRYRDIDSWWKENKCERAKIKFSLG